MRVAVLIVVCLLASDALCAAVCGAVCGTVVQSAVQICVAFGCEKYPNNATHCNTLKHAATRCNILQHTKEIPIMAPTVV